MMSEPNICFVCFYYLIYNHALLLFTMKNVFLLFSLRHLTSITFSQQGNENLNKMLTLPELLCSLVVDIYNNALNWFKMLCVWLAKTFS